MTIFYCSLSVVTCRSEITPVVVPPGIEAATFLQATVAAFQAAEGCTLSLGGANVSLHVQSSPGKRKCAPLSYLITGQHLIHSNLIAGCWQTTPRRAWEVQRALRLISRATLPQIARASGRPWRTAAAPGRWR